MSDDDVARRRGAPIVKILRGILLALLVAFAIGLWIGTVIRHRLEGPPVRYIGASPADATGAGIRSTAATGPLHVA